MELSVKAFMKEARFADLVEAVQHCTLCPRLCDRTRVLSSKNGNLHSAVLFVAEAPGRLGADRTGVPLCGDQTGDNFERLLGNVGWSRDDVFITNALLCNPQDENGNNGPPTTEELANCSTYLEMTIELIDPAVVITLGTVALKAIEYISPHNLVLKEAVGKPTPWVGRMLIPLYHPGPRALVHRGFAKQTSDFLRLAKFVDPGTGIKTKTGTKLRPATELTPETIRRFHHLVCLIVDALGKITYFRLTKLLYLVDVTAIDRFGCSVTGEIYLRQPDGPWPPALQKLLPALKQREVMLSSCRGVQMIEPGPSPRFEPSLDDEVLEVVAEVLEKYGRMSNAEIKSAAYRTRPMRYVLRQERQGRKMKNFPVIYKDVCAPDTDKNGLA